MTAISAVGPAGVGGRPGSRKGLPGVFRWSRTAYEQAVAAGVFEPGPDEPAWPRLELVDGEILTMPPQGPVHATAIDIATDVLRDALAEAGIGDVRLRSQMPIALGEWSEPEPDFVVVRGSARDYLRGHPTDPLLVIEIADATLKRDRTRKARLYARHGVPEYWLLNLRDRVLEVMREPDGERYGSRSVHGPAEQVASSALPGLCITVADLLP